MLSMMLAICEESQRCSVDCLLQFLFLHPLLLLILILFLSSFFVGIYEQESIKRYTVHRKKGYPCLQYFLPRDSLTLSVDQSTTDIIIPNFPQEYRTAIHTVVHLAFTDR